MSLESSTPVFAEGYPVTFRDQTVWRDPKNFDASFVLEVDFDETCFTTLISSGKGPEVHEAYEVSVEQVVGSEARQDFRGYGGLSNRAPLDVIIGLLSREPRFIGAALDHAQEHFAHPTDISDMGLGLIARFANRGTVEYDDLTIRAVTEMLVVRKKEHLIPQISEAWPKPVNGFDEKWAEWHERKENDERWKEVQLAIVSSGHTDFITKTLEVCGLSLPDVFMTDDEMRRQVYPRTKPDPYALELVRNAWFNAYLISAEDRGSSDFVEAAQNRQVYIGDDLEKDGKMAFNDGIHFIHHDGAADTWRNIDAFVSDRIERRVGFSEKA